MKLTKKQLWAAYRDSVVMTVEANIHAVTFFAGVYVEHEQAKCVAEAFLARLLGLEAS